MSNEKTKYSKWFWDTLFNRYYHDEIIKLAGNFPVECALKVEFGDMKQVWGRLGETMGSAIEYLVNNPDNVLDDGNDTLRSFSLLVDRPEGWSEKAHVQISGFVPVLMIKDLKHGYFGKLVSVTGTVAQAIPVGLKIVNAAYECMNCLHITMVRQGDEKLLEPLECENDICGKKGPFKLLLKKSKVVDYQEIILQDSTGAEIEVVLLNDLVDLFYSTIQKVTITGIDRGRQKLKGKSKTPFLEMYIEANHIEVSTMQESDAVLSSHA